MKEPGTAEELKHEIDLLDVLIAEHEAKLLKYRASKQAFESQLEEVNGDE